MRESQKTSAASSGKSSADEIARLQEIIVHLQKEREHLQKSEGNSFDTEEDLRWKLNRSEKEKLDIITKYNEEISRYESQVAKLRAQLEKGEAIRQNVEYEIALVRKDAGLEKCTSEERMANLYQVKEQLKGRREGAAVPGRRGRSRCKPSAHEGEHERPTPSIEIWNWLLIPKVDLMEAITMAIDLLWARDGEQWEAWEDQHCLASLPAIVCNYVAVDMGIPAWFLIPSGGAMLTLTPRAVGTSTPEPRGQPHQSPATEGEPHQSPATEGEPHQSLMTEGEPH
ncbi:UNVERIFIED_CONTAM: hypothetical protein FKN15_029138 [Acipenser sinensis]